MRRIWKMAAAGLAALALTLALASPTLAKLPPSGKYGCIVPSINFESPSQYLGDLRIKGNRYRVNKSRWGKLVPTGKTKFRFKGGPWRKLFRGNWERVDSVLEPGRKITEIELTELDSVFESSYCTKES